jgi:hypothetical protein
LEILSKYKKKPYDGTYRDLIIKNGWFNPLSVVNNNKYEGYWINEQNLDLPIPLINKYPTDTLKEFINVFTKVLENVKKNTSNISDFLGSSKCRICKKYNGSKEFKFTLKENTIYVPEGMLHYYLEHNVNPSDEFYSLVNSIASCM